MKFCRQCGTEIDSDKKFCVSCGAPLAKEAEPSDADASEKVEKTAPLEKAKPANPQPTRKTAEKKPMSPKKKRQVILGSIVAAILLAFYFVGAHITSQERLVSSFNDAILEHDAEKIADLLSYRNPNLEVSAQQAEAFVRYLEENPDEEGYLVESVNQQSKILDENRATAEEGWESLWASEGSIVQLEKDGKFLFYDTYKLYVQPIYLQLQTDFKGTKLYNGEEELAEADSNEFTKEVGPFLPGIYTFSAEFKNDYIDLKQEQEVELTAYNNQDSIYLSVDAGAVYFHSDLDESINSRLVINGEPVEFNAFSGEGYGPAAFDGSMEMAVEADFPWGTSQTKTVALESSDFQVEFPMDKKLKETLTKQLKSFVVSYMDAIAKSDADVAKHIGSDAKAELKDLISYYQDDQYIYHAAFNSLELDTENVEIETTSEGLQVSAYLKGKTVSEYYFQDDEPSLEEEEVYWIYELLYKDDKWVVTSINEQWGAPVEFNKTEPVLSEPVTAILDNSVAKEKEETGEADVDLEADLSVLYEGYLNGLMEAINTGEYSYVEDYIQTGSELETVQRDLVKRLSEKGITEELLGFQINNVTSDGSNYLLDVEESAEIFYSDGTSEVQDYDWEYTAVKDGGQYKLTNIE